MMMMMPPLAWSQMLPADATPTVVDCVGLAPFVASPYDVACCSVHLFQVPDLARCFPDTAQCGEGLWRLYEPYARLLREFGLPLVDFSVGRRNFRFTVRHEQQPVPVPEWAEVVAAALAKHAQGSCGVTSGAGFVQVASDAFLGWDKRAATRAMTEALASHIAFKHWCTAEEAQRGAEATASLIDVAVNPPTMQLHVSSRQDAQRIVDFFSDHTVLCDLDYVAWVDSRCGALQATVEWIQGDNAFKRFLSSRCLPRGAVNAEVQRSTLPTVPTTQKSANFGVIKAGERWRYEPYGADAPLVRTTKH